jgi:glucokinase
VKRSSVYDWKSDKMTGGRWVGVDVGGSWVRVVLSDEGGRFIARARERVDITSSDAISSQIFRLTRSLCSERGLGVKALKGVGIASAGPLDMKEGVLVHPPNLPFERVALTKPVGEQLGLPVCLINDCAGAAIGETMFGAAKGHDHFVYITLSTGIGGGIIESGTLLLGKDGNGHEVGHFVIDCEGRLTCGCGRRGHWEAYCSGRNMPNFVRMRMKELPEKTVKESLLMTKLGGDLSKLVAADLFDAAKKKDPVSVKLINEIGVLNAMGFATAINAYDPSLITVGGTVALKNKSAVLAPIRKHVKDYAINRVPEILITPLGEDVVLYGAVAAALKYLS